MISIAEQSELIYLILKDAKASISTKDWERMLNLSVMGKDGKGVAKTLKNKDKAIARYIAGLKLEGDELDFNSSWNEYSGAFSDFGNKALELGATQEEIKKLFDATTTIPTKITNKLSEFKSKDKKLNNRFVGPISKLILDSGFKIRFLPTNGYAITWEGKDAMARNGRKWTIGYKAEIDFGSKKVQLEFDAITDEGDGPTSYVIANGSDILGNNSGVMGQRKFLTELKEVIKKEKE